MLNSFIGIGRWSQDIEMRYTQSGKAVASCTLAINEKRGDQDNTVFLPVVMWNKLAEVVAQHSGKGRLVAVQGRISTRSYDNREGKKVYVTEIVADNVRFLDRGDSSGQPSKPARAQSANPFEDDSDPFASDGDIDELPF